MESADSAHKKCRSSLVAWYNNLLKTDFKDVRQMGSGACQCQILDCAVPGSIDLTQVKFNAQSEDDYRHNFDLLQEALGEIGVSKTFPIKEITKGDYVSNFKILKWFRWLYNTKAKTKNYDPLSARNHSAIIPLAEDLWTGTKTEPGAEESSRGYSEKWREVFDWAERSPLGDGFTYCSVCKVNLNTYHKGMLDLRRHLETTKHKNREKSLQRAGPKNREPLLCSNAAVRLINRRCRLGFADGDKVSRHFARCKLGLNYPKDISAVCRRGPYCIYVYGGVALGREDAVSVLLVGFFDVDGPRRRVRFLDALQSAGGAADQTAAAVVEAVKKFELPSENLAAVYCRGDGAASEQICSQLRDLNPHVVAIGGLYGLADAASHAGVEKLSNQVQEALAGSDASIHLNAGCLKLFLSVQTMLEKWTNLTPCDQPQDGKVRATLQFLAQALKPLHAFQSLLESREGADADVAAILEEASGLLSTYASFFLRPQAAKSFLKTRDANILKDPASHLERPELGGKAVEEFPEGSEAAGSLREEALAFYAAVTERVSEMLPLSDKALRSAARLLERRPELTEAAVGELGAALGICSSPDEVEQLTGEFLACQGATNGVGEEEEEASLEKHWAEALKDTGPSSPFRKLVLTLLCLPRPPLDLQQVLTQSLETDECAAFTESESDVLSDGGISDHASARYASLLQRMRPCEVRLTKLDLSHIEHNAWLKEGAGRGGSGWESSLRQKPKARTVFQAGAGVWSKPRDLEQDNQISPESQQVADETTPSRKPRRRSRNYKDGKGFLLAELVWGRVRGFSWWPGLVVDWKTKSSPPCMRRVEWFGDGMFSEIHTQGLLPLSAFSKCFCKNSFASLPVYKEAIFQVIELAAMRCGKCFAEAKGVKETELKLMLEWALGGFLPSGPRGFTPPDSEAHSSSPEPVQSDYQPPPKRKYVFKNKAQSAIVQHNRESISVKVKENGRSIEDFCLSCGSTEIAVAHPLFEGGLCQKCKENFSETLFRYDEDGYQSYCTVCCAGTEVILCGNASCCRCFCKDCLDILVDPGTFDKLKDVDPWSCYICKPSDCARNLKLRPDWTVKVQDFFANNSALEFEPHRVYPSIPADLRRPIKVLSLFDGIATGYLVLKEMGFQIERYIASEICEDSIVVGMVKHEGKIEYVNDVRTITRKHLAEWGPFDLLIGGSPCNDLSMVNPLRKGLFEGTGRLFFEFYRILTMLKPKEGDNRPFFWLFENVVFMSAHDKADICRFLECNPVLIDAVKVSPAHRARYFWGNLPGMNRPLATALDNKVALQDCLEAGREAKFDKVRTITTNSNSIRQGKMGPLPVDMNGKEDYLWCTEIEQIFGFPKHYTDVNNMGRMKRQKVLGRSWSVPVIRHLFAPLKDYFKCE